MKQILLMSFMVLCFVQEAAHACLKDENTIRNSWKLAAEKKTFSTSGLFMSLDKNGEMHFSSGTLIDPWTVLSDGHSHQEIIDGETYFSVDSKVSLQLTEEYANDFNGTIKNLDKKLSSEAVLIYFHPDFKHVEKYVSMRMGSIKELQSLLAWSYERHLSLEDPDKSLAEQKFGYNNESLSYWKKDLAIIKLKNPINLDKYLEINDGKFSENSPLIGYSLGYPHISTCEGKKVVDFDADTKKLAVHRAVVQNKVNFNNNGKVLYEQYLSPMSRDGFFVPQKNMQIYGGLFSGGMSGGSFISKIDEEFKIVGVVSRVESSLFYGELTSLLDQCKKFGEIKYKKYIDLINYYMEKINKNSLVYNVWTPVGEADAEWIKKHMGEIVEKKNE